MYKTCSKPYKKFATMAHNESLKNHPGVVTDKPSNEKEARMYETADQFDGYKALKLYLEKINPNRHSSRWRHLTTTTTIQFVFLFIFKFCIPSGVKITIALINIRRET